MNSKLEDRAPMSSETKRGVIAIEKRQHPRYSVELPLDYARAEGKETFGGIATNASEGGLLAYLPEKMEIGTLLKVEVFYVKGMGLDTVKAVARVVWADMAVRESYGEHRYGLQFEQIDDKDFSRLINLLKEAVR